MKYIIKAAEKCKWKWREKQHHKQPALQPMRKSTTLQSRKNHFKFYLFLYFVSHFPVYYYYYFICIKIYLNVN